MKQILLCFLLFWAATATAQFRDEEAINQKKYANAIKKHNRVNDSVTAIFYFKRAGIRCDYKDYANAITDYDKGLKLDPESAGGYYDRGSAKMDAQLPSDAIADFNKAIELDPNQPRFYNNRGISYYKMLNYAEAIKNYDKAIALSPTDGFAYNNRGVAKIKMGAEDGCDDLRKALELGNKNSDFVMRSLCK